MRVEHNAKAKTSILPPPLLPPPNSTTTFAWVISYTTHKAEISYCAVANCFAKVAASLRALQHSATQHNAASECVAQSLALVLLARFVTQCQIKPPLPVYDFSCTLSSARDAAGFRSHINSRPSVTRPRQDWICAYLSVCLDPAH